MKTIPWYQSKVVWLNIITGVISFFAIPEFISIIPAYVMPWIAFVNAVGNWVLRVYFTTKPIQS